MPCSVVFGGVWGSHKTNVVLTKLIDAVIEQNARVVYAAGEGSYGVLKQRLPAHCVARGIPITDFDDKLAVVRAVPLLMDGGKVAAFTEAIRPFKPTIIALDMLATATAGLDENSSQLSGLLTGNGPVGTLMREFGCLVLIVAHMGKDETRGIRGHSGIEGNVDGVIDVKRPGEGMAIELFVRKMKDAPDKFSVYYKVEPEGVPVPIKISKAEFDKLTAKEKFGPGESPEAIRAILMEQNAKTHSTSNICDMDLARLIFPRDSFPGDNTLYNAHIKKVRDRLAQRHIANAKILGTTEAVSDKKNEWRWHLCHSDATSSENE